MGKRRRGEGKKTEQSKIKQNKEEAKENLQEEYEDMPMRLSQPLSIERTTHSAVSSDGLFVGSNCSFHTLRANWKPLWLHFIFIILTSWTARLSSDVNKE